MSEAEEIVEEETVINAENPDEGQLTEEEIEEARTMGWTEKENWRGDSSRWIDADEFLERGRKITPILRKNNERLLGEINELKQRLDRQGATHKDFLDRERTRIQKDADQRIKELKAEKRDAINDMDGDKVLEIEEKMEDIKSQAETPEDTEVPQIDPVFKQWVDDNPFLYDTKNQAVANSLADVLRAEQPGLSQIEFLDELAIRTKRALAKDNPKRNAPSTVESARPSKPSKKHSFANLPKDAQDEAKRYEEEELLSIEDYLKVYEWED